LPITITGHLKKNPKDTSAFIQNVVVLVKGDNKILSKTLTDNKGDFTITFTPKNEKSFDFYCTGLGIDTLLLSSVTTFESDTPEMSFYIPVQHKKTLSVRQYAQNANELTRFIKSSMVMHLL